MYGGKGRGGGEDGDVMGNVLSFHEVLIKWRGMQ